MSGHSKWAQIKRKKAATDAKKGAVFSKIAKEIMVASRLGGPDPNHNFRLRFAIEKAKANHLPQENIQRAIENGAGIGKEQTKIEEVIYEGYGPGKIAILIICTTDNKNRTVSELRTILARHNGKLAEAGAVSWAFTKRGEIKIESQDKLYELAIESGADDIEFSAKEYATIITKPDEVEKVQKFILTKNIKPLETSIVYHPKEFIEITNAENALNIIRLIEELEAQDDVQEVFSNFDIKDEVLAKIKNE